jgi:DNA-binding SARP family transcriptional activator
LETRIQLCGRVVATIRGRRVDAAFPGPQGERLFVFLALSRLRAATRDELTEALWPQGPPASADAALSALLSKLRRALGSGSVQGRRELRLVLPDDAWIDLEAAGEAIHRAESAVALGDWSAAWGPARIADVVSRRGFLPGHEAPWIDGVRRHLHDLRVRSLECVAASGLGLGGPELASAVRSARSLIELEPYRETGYRILMEAHEAHGDVAEALRVYDTLRQRLREDLGVGPGSEARDLHRRLLEQGASHIE